MNGNALLQQAFAAFASNPPDLRGIGDQDGEVKYVEGTFPAYERIVFDILNLFPGRQSLQGLNILELGAFLGVVSKALSLASANVVACDIPEFFARENVKSYYQNLGVPIQAFNLRDYAIPFATGSQDCVIACETFEHLNFNPLPVIAEINRVLRVGGYFYISMPNGAYFAKRIRYLLTGETPGFGVDELFAQLRKDDNMVVGLHWKEYSLRQTIAMVSPIGFEVESTKLLNDTGSKRHSVSKKMAKALIPGGDTQVIVFRKRASFDGDFTACADS